MKKQLLALCALTLLSTVYARETQRSAADQLIAFKTMECGRDGHKSQWFNLLEKYNHSKSELMKKQHEEWAAFGAHNVKKLAELSDFSHAAREKYFQDELKEAIGIHEAQTASWEKLCKSHFKNAQKLSEKHKSELVEFKSQL